MLSQDLHLYKKDFTAVQASAAAILYKKKYPAVQKCDLIVPFNIFH